MKKEYDEIIDRMFEINVKLERLSATAFFLGVTSAGEYDCPKPEILGLTFENISDQLTDISNELSDIQTVLYHEVKKDDSTDADEQDITKVSGGAGRVVMRSRSLSQAIEKGYEIVRAEEPVDLDHQEMMELWGRFEERSKTKPLFDAVIRTAHEAFLCGVVFGRDPRAEEQA